MSHHGEEFVLQELLNNVVIGFYLDIGSNNPINNTSNSHAFYLRGWSGIDVEPIPELCEILRAEHPRNIVEQCAVSNFNGYSTLYRLNAAEGEGATLETNVVQRNMHRGDTVYDIITVQTKTIDSILEQHLPAHIDFVSLDVENHELQALQGFNLQKWKPTVLCIEATIPNTDIPSWHEWEPLVLSSGYSFVTFDGCNRFYKHG